MKKLLSVLVTCGALGVAGMQPAVAANAVSLDQLLQQVKSGRSSDSAANAARIKEFQADRSRQSQLLRQAKADRAAGEAKSAELEAQFDVNDKDLVELERQLQERLGSLKELFGVLQQAAGDQRGQFDVSLTRLQYPDRSEFLTDLAQKMGQSNRLASMEDIERLWFEMQREMTESGKVVKFNASVAGADGVTSDREVTRVGIFNVLSGGNYLTYISETNRLVELPRQPAGRYTKRSEAFSGQTSGLHPLALDPTRGQILNLLTKKPTFRERIDQGGIIGYIIIALGIVALLIALWRLVALSAVNAQVNRQAKNPDNPGNNPLGRVLSAYHSNKDSDLETVELKLGEGILKETPRLNLMVTFLKIVAVVAPLLGLLGTVTGMIITFQQITLFGTGDPKLMAGGISTALMTTVLGLCVAIPTVFLHTIVAGRAKRVTQVLQEQSAGMVARHAEAHHAARTA